MLDDALTNGPTWFNDYTLYGMQWGTKQVFQETVPQLAEEYPDSTIYVSHTWANGTDVFVQFFHLQDTHVQMASILSWLEKKLPLDQGSIFIMTPDEYKAAAGNPKLKDLSTIETIPYPDGRDGFYVTQVSYSDTAGQIFQQEVEALKKPVTEDAMIDGQAATVTHTKFDIGDLDAIFDGDSKTVARGVEANPLVLDVTFQSPRKLQSLEGYFGRADINLAISLYGASVDEPVQYQQQYDYLSTPTEMPAGQAAQIAFDRGPDLVSRAYIEIRYTNDGEGAHVHVFDIQFR
jgi:hypothetical protein